MTTVGAAIKQKQTNDTVSFLFFLFFFCFQIILIKKLNTRFDLKKRGLANRNAAIRNARKQLVSSTRRSSV